VLPYCRVKWCLIPINSFEKGKGIKQMAFTMRINPETQDKWAKAARKNGLTLTEFVRRAVDAHLEKRPLPKPTPQEMRKIRLNTKGK
jgi:hypothetical protein